MKPLRLATRRLQQASLRRFARRTTRIVALGGLLLSVHGCSGDDECKEGDAPRCHNNIAQICIVVEDGSGSHWVWREEACEGGPCVMSQELWPTPFCSRDKEPHPLCRSSGVHSVCNGSEVIDCNEGYVQHSYDCTTGDWYPADYDPLLNYDGATQGHCRNVEDAAFCALEPEPNAVCGSDFRSYPCDGDDNLTCKGGYVVERDDCTARGYVCVEAEPVSSCLPP